MADSEKSRFVVTLVHGTWAGEAEWTKDGSILRTVLENELRGHGGVEFAQPLCWTGDNNHEARLRAAELLYDRLQAPIRDDQIPVVIAHSHAGNITLKVMGLSQRLCERTIVIALATPFLRFNPRSGDLLIVPLMFAKASDRLTSPLRTIWQAFAGPFKEATFAVRLAFLGVLAYFVAVVYFGYRYLEAPMDQSISQLASFVCRLGFSGESCAQAGFFYLVYSAMCVVFVYGIGLLIESYLEARRARGPEWAKNRASAIDKYGYFQSPEKLSSLRLLVMTSRVDEALSALTGAWWVNGASFWTARAIVMVSVVIAFVLTAGAAYSTVSFLARAGVGNDAAIGAMGMAVAFGIVFVGIVGSIAKLIRWLITRIALAIGLGLNDLELGLLTSVKATRRPPSIEHCWKPYGFLELRLRARGLLAHSLLYNHPGAIRDMADWIVKVSSSPIAVLAAGRRSA